MKQYIIPYNFAKEGYVYGKITWSSMVQAIILVGAAGSVIFRLLPFPFKVRMYLAIFILLPLAVLALKGIHELSLFSFLQDFFQTVKDRACMRHRAAASRSIGNSFWYARNTRKCSGRRQKHAG